MKRLYAVIILSNENNKHPVLELLGETYDYGAFENLKDAELLAKTEPNAQIFELAPVNKVKSKHEFVCSECGGTNVEFLAWIDANTNEYRGECGDGEIDDSWCNDCEAHSILITRDEFEKFKGEEESVL